MPIPTRAKHFYAATVEKKIADMVEEENDVIKPFGVDTGFLDELQAKREELINDHPRFVHPPCTFKYPKSKNGAIVEDKTKLMLTAISTNAPIPTSTTAASPCNKTPKSQQPVHNSKALLPSSLNAWHFREEPNARQSAILDFAAKVPDRLCRTPTTQALEQFSIWQHTKSGLDDSMNEKNVLDRGEECDELQRYIEHQKIEHKMIAHKIARRPPVAKRLLVEVYNWSTGKTEAQLERERIRYVKERLRLAFETDKNPGANADQSSPRQHHQHHQRHHRQKKPTNLTEEGFSEHRCREVLRKRKDDRTEDELEFLCRFLRPKSRVLSKVSEGVMKELARSVSLRTYLKNEIPFREGETGNDMFVVLTGTLGIYQKAKKTAQQQLDDANAAAVAAAAATATDANKKSNNNDDDADDDDADDDMDSVVEENANDKLETGDDLNVSNDGDSELNEEEEEEAKKKIGESWQKSAIKEENLEVEAQMLVKTVKNLKATLAAMEIQLAALEGRQLGPNETIAFSGISLKDAIDFKLLAKSYLNMNKDKLAAIENYIQRTKIETGIGNERTTNLEDIIKGGEASTSDPILIRIAKNIIWLKKLQQYVKAELMLKLEDDGKFMQGEVDAGRMMVLDTVGEGMVMGEIALENADAKRTATPVALSDCELLRIMRTDYRRLLRRELDRQKVDTAKFLQSIWCFSKLSLETILHMVPFMRLTVFQSGATIYRQGCACRGEMYFIRTGEIRVSKTSEWKEDREVKNRSRQYALEFFLHGAQRFEMDDAVNNGHQKILRGHSKPKTQEVKLGLLGKGDTIITGVLDGTTTKIIATETATVVSKEATLIRMNRADVYKKLLPVIGEQLAGIEKLRHENRDALMEDLCTFSVGAKALDRGESTETAVEKNVEENIRTIYNEVFSPPKRATTSHFSLQRWQSQMMDTAHSFLPSYARCKTAMEYDQSKRAILDSILSEPSPHDQLLQQRELKKLTASISAVANDASVRSWIANKDKEPEHFFPKPLLQEHQEQQNRPFPSSRLASPGLLLSPIKSGNASSSSSLDVNTWVDIQIGQLSKKVFNQRGAMLLEKTNSNINIKNNAKIGCELKVSMTPQ